MPSYSENFCEKQLFEEKKRLRTIMRGLLEKNASQKTEKSKIIWQKIKQLPEFCDLVSDFASDTKIMTYLDFKNEVETTNFFFSMLAENIITSFAIPCCVDGDIIPIIINSPKELGYSGTLEVGISKGGIGDGILEPVMKIRDEPTRLIDVNRLGLVLVPGLAFDAKGHRLGRGKGFYDKFLEKLPERVVKIGLAFDFQVLDEIPSEQHDISVDIVVSDSSH